MKKELKALIAQAKFVQAIEELIEIGKPFDEKKAEIVRKWEENELYLTKETLNQMRLDYGFNQAH